MNHLFNETSKLLVQKEKLSSQSFVSAAAYILLESQPFVTAFGDFRCKERVLPWSEKSSKYKKRHSAIIQNVRGRKYCATTKTDTTGKNHCDAESQDGHVEENGNSNPKRDGKGLKHFLKQSLSSYTQDIEVEDQLEENKATYCLWFTVDSKKMRMHPEQG
jgi:hypothetical protein